MKIDMRKGKDIAEKNGIDFNNVVKIDGNIVQVKLSSGGGYSYAFFNNVDVSSYADKDDKGEYTGMYILTINKKMVENGG
jgi:hypothetical protein